MNARVVQVDGGPGDGGAPFVRDRVVPALRDQEGWEGSLHVADTDGGRGYSITFWSSAGLLEATNEIAASLRDEAQGQGYDVSLVGQFDVEALEASGGEPKVARVVNVRGGRNIGDFIREQVSPDYQGQAGCVGVIGMTSGDRGIGISLWASDEALDGAEDAVQQIVQALEDAGFQREGLERLAVETCELPRSA